MKFFGWHPGNRQIVYWDGANIMLLDIFKDEPTWAAQPQLWGNPHIQRWSIAQPFRPTASG